MSIQNIRSRKRDEKAKFEPELFRDELVSAINSKDSLEEVTQYLIEQGVKQDEVMNFRRYAEQFFDIIIAGGMLAPGGTLEETEDEKISKFYVFKTDGSDEQIRSYIDLLNQVIQRLKYLQLSLEEEMAKVLKFLKAFTDENREKLAKFVAYLGLQDLCSPKVLESLFIDALTKDDTAEKFMANFFQAWLAASNISTLASAFKKIKLDKKLEELFPANKRSFEYMRERFMQYEGLDDIISWQASLRTSTVKKDLQQELIAAIRDGKESDELIDAVNTVMEQNYLRPVDMVPLVLSAVVTSVNWNKKFDIMTEQALRQFSKYNKLMRAYTQSPAAQVILLVRLQTYCVDVNQPLMKIFTKLILLLYKLHVVEEEAILEWYHEKHGTKGKTILLTEMEPMIQWLNNAEEEA